MQKAIPFSLTLLLLSTVVYSCNVLAGGDGDIKPNVERTYKGIYTQGIEDSSFNPCINREESWRLTINDDSFYKKLSAVGENPVFVKLRGIVSEKGRYQGFFVTYDRTFEVNEVIEVTSTNKNKCLP